MLPARKTVSQTVEKQIFVFQVYTTFLENSNFRTVIS